MGLAFEIDHIIPIAKGGIDDLRNLCLACPECNRYKRDRIDFIDPDTGEVNRFFHPLKDSWHEHFAWGKDTRDVIGLTGIGRSTIAGLRMNRRLLQIARRHWIRLGEHPPT